LAWSETFSDVGKHFSFEKLSKLLPPLSNEHFDEKQLFFLKKIFIFFRTLSETISDFWQNF